MLRKRNSQKEEAIKHTTSKREAAFVANAMHYRHMVMASRRGSMIHKMKVELQNYDGDKPLSKD
jgi:hypothetical protein